MRKYGYESGNTWSMTGRRPGARERSNGVRWFRMTPWEEVEWGTWFKFQPLGPLFMKVNSNVIPMRIGRIHNFERDKWANNLRVVVVSDDKNGQFGIEYPSHGVLVPVNESEVPEDLR